MLERDAWLAADWSDPWAVAAPLVGFMLALYTFALLLPRVLMWSGATVMNLSLLTSDVWAAGARVLFFGGFGGTAGWFALSLVCEAAGLVLYTRAGQTHPHLRVGDVGTGEVAAAGGNGSIESGGVILYQRITSLEVEESDVASHEAGWADRCGAVAGNASVGRGSTEAATLARGDYPLSRSGVGTALLYGLLGTSEERQRLVELEGQASGACCGVSRREGEDR